MQEDDAKAWQFRCMISGGTFRVWLQKGLNSNLNSDTNR